jgi:hypothetical protein
MTFRKNIGSPSGELSIPNNTSGINPSFLATGLSGFELLNGGLSEIARYQSFSTNGLSADASGSFVNIPQNFRHLFMMGQISPGSASTSASNTEYFGIRLNNDTTANNHSYIVEGNASNNTTTHSHLYFATQSTQAITFGIPYTNNFPSPSSAGSFYIFFPNYSQNSQFMYKNFSGQGASPSGIFRFYGRKSGQVPGNDRLPITSIQFGLFSTLRMCADTDIRLYGVS